MNENVVVRFAPSPTGCLHVGALRTALFDFLYAKKTGGKFILRIEDTDQNRYNPDSVSEFLESLAWVGITVDEGPYFQSERKEAGIYQMAVEHLLSEGKVYLAFDTPEELTAMREAQEKNRENTGYFGGKYRDMPFDKKAELIEAGVPYVIRLKVPRDQKVIVHDLIRGDIEYDTNTLDDIVLIKSDGMPTYHFAAMVDDHLMGVTHVIRGEEWLSSAPKHVLLLEALGFNIPKWIHCPVILGNDGKKLSKRHGATAVLDYKRDGFLPEALINFIALIGWSPGEDKEVMTMDEMIQEFDFDGLQSGPGRFDFEKLRWMNKQHMDKLSDHMLGVALMNWVNSVPEDTRILNIWHDFVCFFTDNPEQFVRILGFVRNRAHTLAELPLLMAGLMGIDVELSPKPSYYDKIIETGIMGGVAATVAIYYPTKWIEEIRDMSKRIGFPMKEVAGTIRYHLWGYETGPALDELLNFVYEDLTR